MSLGSIIFVDDSDSICRVYARILEDADYFVRYATTGKQALELMACNMFEVVVCDYNLGNVSGLELIDSIRRIDKNIYSILFTSNSSDDIEEKALACGVNDFILKGCNIGRLLVGIKKGMKTRQEWLYRDLMEKKILELSQLTQEYHRDAI